MLAQNSFVLVSFMVKGFGVVSSSGFEIGASAANVRLHLFLAVRLGLDHLGLVHNVVVKAGAL